MILGKIKKILNNNEGMALIVALCVSTFIMALSLAVIYSTAQVSGNISNKKLREEAYWQASTIGDQIAAYLVKDDYESGDDPQMDTDIYEKLSDFCETATLDKVYTFSYAQTDDELKEYFGDIKIALKLTEDASYSEDDDGWPDSGASGEIASQIIQYNIYVTVTVTTKSGASASVTDLYEANEVYDYEYTYTDSEHGDRTCTYITSDDSTTNDRFRISGVPDDADDTLKYVYIEDAVMTMEQAAEKNGESFNGDETLTRERVDSSKLYQFIYSGRE